MLIAAFVDKSSKRYWKIKLKEWKFEKNVPSKEMSFMAAKARKRELEHGKETVFYRNRVLVDASKVQNKKQKLNLDDVDKLMVPGKSEYL
jgi:plasmid rolling circle replication initiator protein Rep